MMAGVWKDHGQAAYTATTLVFALGVQALEGYAQLALHSSVAAESSQLTV